jgi:hypothetical protein
MPTETAAFCLSERKSSERAIEFSFLSSHIQDALEGKYDPEPRINAFREGLSLIETIVEGQELISKGSTAGKHIVFTNYLWGLTVYKVFEKKYPKERRTDSFFKELKTTAQALVDQQSVESEKLDEFARFFQVLHDLVLNIEPWPNVPWPKL